MKSYVVVSIIGMVASFQYCFCMELYPKSPLTLKELTALVVKKSFDQQLSTISKSISVDDPLSPSNPLDLYLERLEKEQSMLPHDMKEYLRTVITESLDAQFPQAELKQAVFVYRSSCLNPPVALSADGKVAIVLRGKVNVYDTKHKQQYYLYNEAVTKKEFAAVRKPQSDFYCKVVAFSQDSSYIAAGTKGGVILVSPTYQSADEKVILSDGHSAAITAVLFDSQGRIISADEQGVLCVWTKTMGQYLPHFLFQNMRPISGLAVHPNGGLIATDADTVHVWYKDGEEYTYAKEIKGIQGLCHASFDTSGKAIVYMGNGAITHYSLETHESSFYQLSEYSEVCYVHGASDLIVIQQSKEFVVINKVTGARCVIKNAHERIPEGAVVTIDSKGNYLVLSLPNGSVKLYKLPAAYLHDGDALKKVIFMLGLSKELQQTVKGPGKNRSLKKLLKQTGVLAGKENETWRQRIKAYVASNKR